ncbi:insulin-like growth factor-binding protein complex acid labile subunit [Tribolium madens]|uniref:insulin-like growth factor-binding protein complex acid labile subunit n=1 Tax=Tribolium madens TaxID=41895 RepID=UPI001CF74253|nr:insulin-like growth factor-binding protein complex acid labile subunit [Tribolium madens]
MSTFTRIILFVLIFEKCNCECAQTYMTVCDKVEDIFERNVCRDAKATICTDLLVKSEAPRELVQLDLKGLYGSLCRYDLKNLIIVGQFIADTISTDCANVCLFDLENLSFYNNIIKEVTRISFPATNGLRKLSLVRNSIEIVYPSSFSLLHVKNIDLSHNNINAIEEGTFNYSSLLVITLKHNKLTFIHSGSFGVNLELLDLSYNNLATIKEQVFANTENIRELILSHNQLREVPNISTMKNLQALALSNNEIRTIQVATFANLQDLRLIDLSHNKLVTATPVLNLFVNKVYMWAISLAFNNLKNIEDSVFRNVTTGYLMLFGNPWMCNQWMRVEKLLIIHGIKRVSCDFSLFGCGSLPHCISDFVKDSEVKSATQHFLDAVSRKHDLLSECYIDIHSELYDLLHPYGFDYMCLD